MEVLMMNKNIYKKEMSSIKASEELIEGTKMAIRAEIPGKRKAYIDKKSFKSASIAAAVILLCITSVFAAKNYDVIEEFFTGNFESMEDFVNTPYESVSDGRFKMTLNEVLADNNYIFMVFSIEGLTDDAVEELMHTDRYDDFMYMTNKSDLLCTITISPRSGSGFQSLYEITEKRTDTTRYWAYKDKLADVGKEPLRLCLNKMNGEQYITIPTDCNVETLELTLAEQQHGDVFINISPIGIAMEKALSNKAEYGCTFTNVFFRMANGEIKTYNQLTSLYKSSMMTDECASSINYEPLRYRYDAEFYDAIQLSDLKSIIVGNTEYDIKNPTQTSYVELDKTLYPFEQRLVSKDGKYFAPVDDICEKLGADIEWSNNNMAATIRYHGRTVDISADGGTCIYMSRGRVFNQKDTIYEGKLAADIGTLLYGLNVTIREVRDDVWIIIP